MTLPFQKSLRIVIAGMVLAGCVSTIPTNSSTPAPVQDAPGIGDTYYPNMGNGGYDAQHYLIALDVDPKANELKGSVTMEANALENLGSFNLDFHALTIESVIVNDRAAKFTGRADELTITPSKPLEMNQPFTVVIEYSGSPELFISEAAPFPMGWSHAENGAINVWGEPEAAKTWFPNNNHPRDKATYRFEIAAPNPWIVAASGALRETKADGDKTLFVWEMDQPMATYLASINIDRYDLVTRTGPNGMTIRNYFPVELLPSYRLHFNALPAMIDFFDNLFGPYPFEEYGVVVAAESGLCDKVDLALEAQSMSIHCPSVVMTSEWVIAHELAHQWFGDSVSLENWQDIWLKEGFATYAEWLWNWKNDPVKVAERAKLQQSRFFDSDYPVAGPAPEDLYTHESYTGGALVLQALRLEVGDETFFDILRAYAERYQYGYAGTDEFIAVAEEVSGEDLNSFFNEWLFSKTLPKLPE